MKGRDASRIARLFVKEEMRKSFKVAALLSTNRTENHNEDWENKTILGLVLSSLNPYPANVENMVSS
jgi:hypothetical protein